MKKLIIVLCFLPFLSLSQRGGYIAPDTLYKLELPVNDEKKIEFVEIVQVPGKTQAELYSFCRAWIADNYNSANDVIQMDDKESGQLIVKGIHIAENGSNIHHNLKLYTKDNKVKIELGNLILKDKYPSGSILSGEYVAPIEEIIIDDLYKANGKPKTASMNLKNDIIRFWLNTKIGIKDYLDKSASKKDDW